MKNDTRASVAISVPLSFPKSIKLPDVFSVIENEADLSFRFGQRFKNVNSCRIARIALVWKLLSIRNKFDAIVVGRYGEYFSFFQGLFPIGRKKLLLMDVEWYGERRSKFLRNIKKIVHRVMARGAWKISVFCEIEAQQYSQYYGIPIGKFIWMPFCTDIDKGQYEPSEHEYIFTGGLHHRDYKTLYFALKDLPIEVKICAPLNTIPDEYISQNMTVMGVVKGSDYFDLIARAKLVVLSLQPDLRRCPGVITYVAAMKFGKAVVVNEEKGSASYIKNGETGVIVKPEDPVQLKQSVLTLLNDDHYRRRISENAYFFSKKNFSSARLIEDLLTFVDS